MAVYTPARAAVPLNFDAMPEVCFMLVTSGCHSLAAFKFTLNNLNLKLGKFKFNKL